MHTQATKLGAQHSAKCRTRPPRPDRTGLEVGGGGGGSCKSGDTPLFSHTAGWSHLLLWELLGSPAVNRVCVCRTVSSDLIKRLAAGVEQLLALGHPPSAISMFDEAWLLAASLSPLIEELTGNVPLGDWFTFHVHGGAKSQSDLVRNPSSRPRAGWGPHRDRPGGVDQADAQLAPGFREDGSPMYTTVWVALTDATPDNSCLYFLPACNDPGYKKQGDNIEGVFDDLSRWQAISAQPVNAGGFLVFSHRTLHWGSLAKEEQPPRIALSFAFADPAFETPFFDPKKHLPLPPLRLRAALQAGQAVMYSNQVPLSKAALALNERIFNRHSNFFLADYAAKISSKAQWERFLMKVGAPNKCIPARRGERTKSHGSSGNNSAKTHDKASFDLSWQASDSVQANIFDVSNNDSSW
eukprot:INCI9218.2.p1 GENE.INCI9218.2~~INCI9218.2.p1  ORF type:complete len:411 (-),score=54.05 INCI9218.2:350-1582(-)